MSLPRSHLMSAGLLLLFSAAGLSAAEPSTASGPAKPTLPAKWMEAFQWRSIGPANMSGRITSIAVNERDPATWWVATASGGLLKTTNNGVTFEHQFDREATVSIGDVQVARSNPEIVWVGTGEANPRNSASWGDGVYKSADGGKTWKNMGLKKIFQTGRIAIHPRDPKIVYVGALGRLWGPNEERGLFKTTDGGETWQKILYVDDKTGIIDVAMHPSDPETLIVATYERQRDGFDSNDPKKKYGSGSGLYKTTDGGKAFKSLTEGLPTCKLGRIGISYYRADPKYVYTVLESEKIGQEPPNAAYAGLGGTDAEVGARVSEVIAKGPAERAGLKKGDVIVVVDGVTVHSYADFLREIRQRVAGDKAKLEVSRDHKGVDLEITFGKRPQPKKQPSSGRGGSAGRPPTSSPFGGGLGGQRENLHDQQGEEGQEYGGVYRSEDGGESWTRINSVNPRPMYYSQIRVDPRDNKYIYVLGTSLYRSSDGGKTFTPDGARGGVHADHHAMWIDPRDPRHMILGNDGGIYVTYDRMENWDHHNHVAIGQFYHVAVGPRRDYRVYGGLQDNGSWGGPGRTRGGPGPVNSDWIRVGGGDGFVCLVDPDDADQIYFESQNGRMGRINLRTGQRGSIYPQAPKGVKYRFNWKTPFVLSPQNPRIHYSAGNYVFRSIDRGNRLQAISPEITRTDQGSGSALAASPLDEDVLYVGTTDGALWITRNGGRDWTDLFADPPKDQEPKDEKEKDPKDKKEADKPSEGKEAKGTKQKPSGEAAGAKDDAEDAKEDDKQPPKDGSQPLKELLPKPPWVSSIEASRALAGRAYVTFDGHRSNDDLPHVFVTENYGKTWLSIRANLPETAGSARVVREDIENPDVLYLGTECAVWVSVDRGASWTRLNGNLPTVAVHEIASHRTSGEIVAGTHGRSLWVLDVTALRQISAETVKADAFLYKPNDVVRWHYQPGRGSSGTRRFVGQNPDDGAQVFYSLGKDAGQVDLTISDIEGRTIRKLEAANNAGLHVVRWDLRREARGGQSGRSRGGLSVRPGSYLVTLTVDDQPYRQSLTVLADPDYPESTFGRDEYRQWQALFREQQGEHDGGRADGSRVD